MRGIRKGAAADMPRRRRNFGCSHGTRLLPPSTLAPDRNRLARPCFRRQKAAALGPSGYNSRGCEFESVALWPYRARWPWGRADCRRRQYSATVTRMATPDERVRLRQTRSTRRGSAADTNRESFDSESPRRASAMPWHARGGRPVILGIAVAALVLLAAYVSGAIDGTNTTLVVMGFDPDRAQLLTSLLIGAIAAAAVTLATGRFGLATMLGFVVVGVLFVGTFTAEMQGALAAKGIDGAFDLGGWLLTLLTLVVSGLTSSWAGAALASTARPAILQAAAVLKDAVRRRRVERRALRYPLTVALVLVLLVVTVPAFGDLVNFAPDSLMRGGAAQVVVAATAGPSGQIPGASAPSPTPTDQSTATPASASPTAADRSDEHTSEL